MKSRFLFGSNYKQISLDPLDGDPRRRAQSKSPARRTAASNGYLDNVASDMSELSKKFREFGDAVRQRMSRKPNAHSGSSASVTSFS